MIRVVLFALLIWITGAGAAVFQWQDRSGQYHFSDRPSKGSKALTLRADDVYHRVDYVYDGDTVRLDDGRKVRLLNINAPEIETEHKRGEPGGEEARRRVQSLLTGQRVRMEYDVERYDKYGRLLAHLFTEHPLHLNRLLVVEGLAIANLHPPNMKYAEAILAAQAEAERERRGIWGLEDYSTRPVEMLRRKHLRGWQRLTGIPTTLKEGRKYVKLLFADDLAVTVPRANLEWFPPLDTYLGHRVEVRGWPSRRGRRYSILVRHPNSLLIVD